jgi:hypothetical protein
VEQGGAERLGVEPHASTDLGHANWVGDELIAGVAQLVGVTVAGEVEGVLDRDAIDRRDRDGNATAVAVAVIARTGRGVELLNYGKEISQELLAGYGCRCASRYWRASSWRAL